MSRKQGTMQAVSAPARVLMGAGKLVFLFCGLVGLVVAAQNHTGFENGLLPVAGFFAVAWALSMALRRR